MMSENTEDEKPLHTEILGLAVLSLLMLSLTLSVYHITTALARRLISVEI
jgi:hypothetical protein